MHHEIKGFYDGEPWNEWLMQPMTWWLGFSRRQPMPPIPPSVKVFETRTEDAEGLNTLGIKGFHHRKLWNHKMCSKNVLRFSFSVLKPFLSDHARYPGAREDHPNAPETCWSHGLEVFLRVCTAKHASTLPEQNV